MADELSTANLYQCNGWGDFSLDCKSEAFAVSFTKAVESPLFDRDNIWVLIRDCCFVFFRDWNHAMSNKPENYGCTNRMFFPLICAIDFTISFKSVASHSDFSGLHVFFVVRSFDLFDSCWALRSGGWLWRGRQEQDTGVGGWSNYWDLKSQKVQINHTLLIWGWEFFGYLVISRFLMGFCGSFLDSLFEDVLLVGLKIQLFDVVWYFNLNHTIGPDQTGTPYYTSFGSYVFRSWV